MIVKDKSIFVVMDALNQVRRRRRMEKLLSHLHDVTGRVAVRFRYISLLHFINDDALILGCNFSSHASHLRFHDDSSMSTTSLLKVTSATKLFFVIK